MGAPSPRGSEERSGRSPSGDYPESLCSESVCTDVSDFASAEEGEDGDTDAEDGGGVDRGVGTPGGTRLRVP